MFRTRCLSCPWLCICTVQAKIPILSLIKFLECLGQDTYLVPNQVSAIFRTRYLSWPRSSFYNVQDKIPCPWLSFCKFLQCAGQDTILSQIKFLQGSGQDNTILSLIKFLHCSGQDTTCPWWSFYKVQDKIPPCPWWSFCNVQDNWQYTYLVLD